MVRYILDAVWTILLVIIAFKDGRERRIPDSLTIGVFLCAVLELFFLKREDMLLQFAGLGASAAIFFVILLLAPGAFGGGDIKLSAANGLYLGMVMWFKSFVIAVFAAGAFILYKAVRHRKVKGEEIAFGPFLCLGAVITKGAEYFL